MTIKTVLLAEDDEISRMIIAQILSYRQDIRLFVVTDGKAALEVAMDRRFDLMIFDCNMPYIPGDRVIRQLKAGRTINAKTPVIQITADIELVKAGVGGTGLANVVVSKPISSKEFLAIIIRLLGI